MTNRAEEMQPFAAANQVIDGPEVLTWLRGRLVHPKDAGEPYRIEDLVTDAWRLVNPVRGSSVAAPDRLQRQVLTANAHWPVGEEPPCAVGDLNASSTARRTEPAAERLGRTG